LRLNRKGLAVAGLAAICLTVSAYAYVRFSGTPEEQAPQAVAVIPTPEAPAAPAATPVIINRGLPVRLAIPSLGVDAAVSYMGLTGNGEMEVPKDIYEAGWYKNGTLPGNSGSAVIAGHVNGSRGQPGIFSGLHTMKAGDSITVTDAAGAVSTFTVRESRTFGQDDRPADVFNSTQGTHLNLITCKGDWDAASHRYSERLVVFADMVP
jgi:LPXTG-site transpeptidase (sortase) family protein